MFNRNATTQRTKWVEGIALCLGGWYNRISDCLKMPDIRSANVAINGHDAIRNLDAVDFQIGLVYLR